MSDFETNLLQNFARAALGEERTFAIRDGHGDHVVVRELLYAAEQEIFIFSNELPPNLYSPAIFRNIVSGKPSLRIRFLIGRYAADAVFTEIGDLIAPVGPIALRTLDRASPLQFIVVDAKHLRIQEPNETIVALNASPQSRNALLRLEKAWRAAAAFSPPVAAAGKLKFKELAY
jgi:hypothetical protein